MPQGMARHPLLNPRRFGSLLDRAIRDSSVEMMPSFDPGFPILRLSGRREQIEPREGLPVG
jgi:hypothetical protein